MKEDGFIRRIANQVRYHAPRVLPDYIPALQERYETERIPPSAEKLLAPEEAGKFSESLVTPEQRLKLHNLVTPLPDGPYLFRDLSGTPEDGTRHPHDLVIVKSASGAQFFFIDPEYAVGNSKNHNPLGILRIGDVRPQVNVLYSLELSSENKIVRISLLRYRAAVIPNHKQAMNKLDKQLQMAKSMLASGTLPEVLEGHENEITFRLDFRPTGDQYKVSAQARAAHDDYAVGEMIENLAVGRPMPHHNPLEGQLRRFKAIMRTYFPKFLEEEKFKALQ